LKRCWWNPEKQVEVKVEIKKRCTGNRSLGTGPVPGIRFSIVRASSLPLNLHLNLNLKLRDTGMKLLLIGSGGREHALAWALSRSAGVKRLYCAPGNPGIGRLAELVPIRASDREALLQFALREQIDLTVVGPEQPLADGVVDLFREHGLAIFGPSRRAAELEWSKVFAKEFMARHHIPTASSRTFCKGQEQAAGEYLAQASYPIVIKADGLAAGKGVLICHSCQEATGATLDMLHGASFGEAGTRVVIEEFLSGEEASVFALTDGVDYIVLAPAQDHKRALDNDEGKNTGGMGAYAPTPLVNAAILQQVEREIMQPTLKGMASEGRTYTGCLYVGLIITRTGPKVIEFNSRFGDPETQVVLPLFTGDLAQVLSASTRGGISGYRALSWSPGMTGTAVCVVLASGGYPDAYEQGKVITGLDTAESNPSVHAFHAGTRVDEGRLVTAGGRVLGITAVRSSGGIAETIRDAYRAVAAVRFDGMHYRRDIGHRALIYAIGSYIEGTQQR
jgi:phosphoribosylamine---glycine ligase